MNQEELKKVLDKHRIWIATRQEQGERANLVGANLAGINLDGTDLIEANLRGADLRRANMDGADLRGANLRGANLIEANLRGANLIEANLCGIIVSYLTAGIHPAPEGELIAWKKLLDDRLCKLRIPADARRSCATTRKFRSDYVVVLEGEGYTQYCGLRTEYRPGERIDADSWDPCRWHECSNGIHWFLTREEAESWRTYCASPAILPDH